MTALRSRTGFTLVEVGIGLALAMVLLLAVFSSLSMANKARLMSVERDTAREACRARLESISDLPFDAVAGLDGEQFPVPNPADFPGGLVPPGVDLASSVAGEQAGRVTVRSTPAPASPTLLHVLVEVRWLGRDGSANRLELGTYLARRD